MFVYLNQKTILSSKRGMLRINISLKCVNKDRFKYSAKILYISLFGLIKNYLNMMYNV